MARRNNLIHYWGMTCGNHFYNIFLALILLMGCGAIIKNHQNKPVVWISLGFLELSTSRETKHPGEPGHISKSLLMATCQNIPRCVRLFQRVGSWGLPGNFTILGLHVLDLDSHTLVLLRFQGKMILLLDVGLSQNRGSFITQCLNSFHLEPWGMGPMEWG